MWSEKEEGVTGNEGKIAKTEAENEPEENQKKTKKGGEKSK